MPHRRHTITVATSALFFVCLMLHAQAGPSPQAFTPYNGVEAYKVYEALLPADWTRTVAHARRLLLQARASSPKFRLNPPQPARASHADSATAILNPSQPSGNLSAAQASNARVSSDSRAKNMRWMGAPRAWAS